MNNPYLYKFFNLTLLFSILTFCCFSQDSTLTKKQIRQINNKKVHTKLFEISNFDSYTSYLYAVEDVVIHSNNPEVASTRFKKFTDTDRFCFY
jgi:hypothetical protein